MAKATTDTNVKDAALSMAEKELAVQKLENERLSSELAKAHKDLLRHQKEKGKRAAELGIANIELVFQTEEKEKRAAELGIANEELVFQNEEKEKRAAELVIANYARSLIEASLDPLVTISTEGKILDVNEASIKVTGEPREKLIGTDFSDYFTEPKQAQEGYLQVFEKGFVSDYPLTIKHKNGNHTAVLYNASVYKDAEGHVLGVFAAARDITEQKRIANELTEAKIFAENAMKAKQQFLSNMSHEIRTPMNAIIGFTKVVLKTEINPKQKEYLSAIKTSGDALIVLINDILDLAKVDAGKMTFEKIPFKLSASISAMIHLFETKVQEKNIRLVREYDKRIPEVLEGDPVRLHQIILNLLSNAVKFTHQGGITISVMILSEDEEQVMLRFSVADTGIGISDAKLERVFENFQQASSSTSRIYGGTGLGLAIVKQLVEQQGGTVWVESMVDKGSTFSFELPFAKTNAEVNYLAPIEDFDTDFKNIKVLVVEDIALNQLLMKTLLDDFGFERDIAENGKVAIEMLKTKSYDIILMDLQMPEMNGFEATEYIRNTLHSRVPIIALTADVTSVDLDKCEAVGMNGYIAKPVDERLLYSKIINLVQKPIARIVATEVIEELEATEQKKYTDLAYLIKRTKSNPELMIEMISAYLEQTPPLVAIMNESVRSKDWAALQSAVHKMIPSFSIMGMSSDFEELAKRVQEYAHTQMEDETMEEMVTLLGNACTQACYELTEELNRIKSLNT